MKQLTLNIYSLIFQEDNDLRDIQNISAYLHATFQLKNPPPIHVEGSFNLSNSEMDIDDNYLMDITVKAI